MSTTAKSYSIVLLVLSSLVWLESTFAQVSPDSIPVAQRTRDTIVIIKRDTIVVLQKTETVRIVKDETSDDEPDKAGLSRGRGGSGYSNGRGNGRENSDVVERRRQLREQRIREYQEWYDAQPIVRQGDSWAYKYYVTALAQQDFPSIKFGVEKTIKGRFGVQGNFGILTPPTDFWNIGFDHDYGEARFGIRGLDLGLSGRYYFSDIKKRFPFYMELEAGYSIAPVTMGIWASSADGTFDQYVEAPVNGQRFFFGFLAGWELRSKEGVLLDLATGLRIGGKSIRSSNDQVQEIISQRFWRLNPEGAAPLFSIVTRIGIGYGKWNGSETDKTSSKKTNSRKKKKRRRR